MQLLPHGCDLRQVQVGVALQLPSGMQVKASGPPGCGSRWQYWLARSHCV